MKAFNIFIRTPDNQRLRAGELALSDQTASGQYSSAFQYDANWLAHPGAFPLDPESLPLKPERFSAVRLTPPLSVFEDALPDAWGRKLLFSGVPQSHRTDAHLIALRGSNGLGALEFSDSSSSRAPSAAPAAARVVDLPQLVEQAEAFERGLPIADDSFRQLLAAGSSPGGARPKVLADDEHGQWIAKFPSAYLDGRFDVVGLEKASMDCAQAAAIEVPDTLLRHIASRKILLVRRFDVTPLHGRHHMVSLATLCKERTDWTVSHYDAVAQAVRRHSACPEADIRRLFRQTIFNGLLGNTDDHLKNFAMIQRDGGFRLSPAFDLLPDYEARKEHCMAFGLERYLTSLKDVTDMAKRWNLEQPLSVLKEVIIAVERFADFADAADVPRANTSEIVADIQQRIARVAR